MKLSDSIANYILQLLDDGGSAEIKRNELANTMGCVPSQINYVLTSRFTPEQGYRVESRRGGGGYIRITRIYQDSNSALAHIIRSIGDQIDGVTSRAVVKHLLETGMISSPVANVMAAALSDRSLQGLMQPSCDRVRASILKHMIMALL